MIVILFVASALVVIALIAVLNAFTFPRLRRAVPAQPPRVSVLIPARNEAAVIGSTVSALLSQSGVEFELLILDDHSSDSTAAAAQAAAADDPRLRVIGGADLPAGWLGKNWACHQLAEAASAPILIFTDADVRWEPGALAALVAELERSRADLLTVWPTQTTITWGERLVVPLMALVILGYLPALLVHHTRWPAFAAANGQCLAFRRAAYAAVGGHAAVRGSIIEDIVLARRAKAHGLRLRMVDGAGLIGCRMYTDWPSVRDGYAKNILAGYGGRVSFLLLATVFHWLIFLLPPAWLAAGAFIPLAGWPLAPLLLTSLGIATRALTAAVTRQRPLDALLLPLSVILMTRIAAQAIFWQQRYGGPRWKGRTIAPGVLSKDRK